MEREGIIDIVLMRKLLLPKVEDDCTVSGDVSDMANSHWLSGVCEDRRSVLGCGDG